MKQVSVVVLLLLVLITGGRYLLNQPGRQGAPKFEVAGSVFVNGKPEPGIQVRFIADNKELSGHDQTPVAITNDLGRFHLSSFGDQDGAVAGDYSIVFFWPTNAMKPDKDRFQEKFLHPGPDSFRATIIEGPNDLAPFRLTVAAEELLPLEVTIEELQKMSEEDRKSMFEKLNQQHQQQN